MRFRPHSGSVLVLAVLSLVLAGCTSSSSFSVAPLSTGSLAAKPSERIVRDEQRTSSAEGFGQPYRLSSNTPTSPERQYTDPGTPTPRQYAAYPSSGAPSETGSLRPGYHPAAPFRHADTPRPVAPMVTDVPGSEAGHIVEVQEGETLSSLSRRHNVPVGDLVAANRLSSDRIAIGQRLVIPTRYR